MELYFEPAMLCRPLLTSPKRGNGKGSYDLSPRCSVGPFWLHLNAAMLRPAGSRLYLRATAIARVAALVGERRCLPRALCL
ncbi:hypothetical protein BHM03_00012135 [Ensete ventricosum]|uniref:Uncharacterized protein n=1 Tax=Ensete ventricosum TaxID=4639 RepID=A0A445MDK5_ENSVE|nr:hypothetical protein BHM03_00012135 [Ensete ventricosum]